MLGRGHSPLSSRTHARPFPAKRKKHRHPSGSWDPARGTRWRISAPHSPSPHRAVIPRTSRRMTVFEATGRNLSAGGVFSVSQHQRIFPRARERYPGPTIGEVERGDGTVDPGSAARFRGLLSGKNGREERNQKPHIPVSPDLFRGLLTAALRFRFPINRTPAQGRGKQRGERSPLPIMQALARQDGRAVFLDAVAAGLRLFGAADLDRIAALAAGGQRVEGGAELGVRRQRLGQFLG